MSTEQTTHRRVIGRHVSAEAGPTLVCVGGLHGNEPAGYQALERVTAYLDEHPLGCGAFHALAGNVAALDAGERYLDRDLNRGWDSVSIEQEIADTGQVDDAEQGELVATLRTIFGQATGPVFLLDLHTTSGPGAPFAVFADTLRSRDFAQQFPCPLVLGLEEHLNGTMVDFVAGLGHAAAAVEGGQHHDPDSVHRLEDAVYLAMNYVGIIHHLANHRGRLESATAGLPSVFEIRYRHAISDDDEFRMRTGFASFDMVQPGEVLADSVNGEVLVPYGGRLLMPLYQRLGEDGFFVIERVWPFWLKVSAALRHARAGRYVHLLPGVRRHPDDPSLYVVDQRIARWFAMEILHLLGFKRLEQDGHRLIVRRRKYDFP